MSFFSLKDVIISIKEVLLLLDRSQANRDKVVEALTSLQTAIIETRLFIREKGYVPNTDLSKLWFAAFDCIKKTKVYRDDNFPDFLYQKARFWGDPQTWLQEPGAMELVPQLTQLETACESLRGRLQ